MPPSEITAKVGLPFGLGEISGTWLPSEVERNAAWDMYVELITRVTVVELGPDEGLLREALTSFYSLFETTRAILKKYGPAVAQPTVHDDVSFAHLAISMLNRSLRPLLARWHPLLADYESQRPTGTSQTAWEKSWIHHDDLRRDIGEVRASLTAYAGLLGEVCGSKDLLRVTERFEG